MGVTILAECGPRQRDAKGMKSRMILFGTGAGILAVALLGIVVLLVVGTWVAVLDRYRAASRDVLGIEGRD